MKRVRRVNSTKIVATDANVLINLIRSPHHCAGKKELGAL
jgi:hypothetical protein